jgi:RNA polymerase sigma-70 factor, ECF subfamily
MFTAGAHLAVRRLTNEIASQEDQRLLAEARSGSRVAFADIQERHSTRLYKKILSITRNREDAEDALQDTFLRAFTGIHSFEGRSQFSTWLNRIAINSALLVVRKRRTRSEVSFHQTSEWGNELPSLDVPDRSPDPEESYDLKQRHSHMLKAIERLDPKSRCAIGIWMSHDCSIKELARNLDVSLASAKSRLHRARRNLAQPHISMRHQTQSPPPRTAEIALSLRNRGPQCVSQC